MNPSSIESYITRNNPSEVIVALKEMGAPDPIDKQDLLYKVHVATEKYGEKAFKRLAEIDTPYKRMILAYATEPEKEKKSNCCGADGGEQKSNCSGCPSFEKKASATGEEKSENNDKTMHYIAIASVVLLAVITIKTVVTK